MKKKKNETKIQVQRLARLQKKDLRIIHTNTYLQQSGHKQSAETTQVKRGRQRTKADYSRFARSWHVLWTFCYSCSTSDLHLSRGGEPATWICPISELSHSWIPKTGIRSELELVDPRAAPDAPGVAPASTASACATHVDTDTSRTSTANVDVTWASGRAPRRGCARGTGVAKKEGMQAVALGDAGGQQ